jgi:hypothetical protein
LDNYIGLETKEDEQEEFCECRLSDKVDNYHGISFYWCGNKPCFRPLIRYRTDDEWEYYTILDFMRILGINPDYINKNGKRTKFGNYIILSSYLKSFAKFYEHLNCRECGKLMKPSDITILHQELLLNFLAQMKVVLKKDLLYTLTIASINKSVMQQLTAGIQNNVLMGSIFAQNVGLVARPKTLDCE